MTAVRSRAFSPGHASVVLVTLVSWFLISNHCALGALNDVKMGPHAACHGGGAPTKPSDHNDDQTPCCKSLDATFTELSKPIVSFDVSAFALEAYFVGLISFPDHSDLLRPLELDTGPPFSGSFAESVLQRSILAHAPPVSLS